MPSGCRYSHWNALADGLDDAVVPAVRQEPTRSLHRESAVSPVDMSEALLSIYLVRENYMLWTPAGQHPEWVCIDFLLDRFWYSGPGRCVAHDLCSAGVRQKKINTIKGEPLTKGMFNSITISSKARARTRYGHPAEYVLLPAERLPLLAL